MKNVSVKHYKAARCILYAEDKFLLAIHHHTKAGSTGKWGLPGGHTEAGEQLEATVRRELTEELRFHVGDLQKIGDYPHNDHWHRIYGAQYHGQIQSFDCEELEAIAWYSLDQVLDLHECHQLHAGWEYAAICQFDKILNPVEFIWNARGESSCKNSSVACNFALIYARPAYARPAQRLLDNCAYSLREILYPVPTNED